jgi:hypothetical protein
MSQSTFKVDPVPASPHHRHQTSLKGWPSSSDPLEPDQRTEAIRVFNQIISYYESSQTDKFYKPITLIRLTYEYVRSRNNFLKYFFKYMEGDLGPALSRFANIDKKNDLALQLANFADYLIDNFSYHVSNILIV